MKKAKVLLSAFVALAMVALVACAPRGGSKKKKSTSGGSGGAVPELAWEGGFSGAVSVGASTSVVEGREAQVMPSNAKTSFATLANKRSYADLDTGDTYEFSFTFEYSAKVGTEAKPVSEYIQAESVEGDKTLLQFKGWPSQTAKTADYPRFTVKATGTCNGETKEKTYVLVLNPLDKVFIKMSLAELYSAHADGNKLKWMGPKKDTGGTNIPNAYTTDLTQTEGQSSYWIETKGYITYCTNDDNWAILQNGEHSVQLYQLTQLTTWPSMKSSLMNKPVIVQGQISEGYGNVQLSYVQKIIEAEAGDTDFVTPVAPATYTEAIMSNKNWVTNPMFNKTVLKTAVTFKGNIRTAENDKETQAVTDPSKIDTNSGRYEFDVQIGSTVFTVASDYHTVKDSTDFRNNFNDVLRNAKDGDTIYVGGTIRWQNDRATVSPSSPTKVENDYSVRVEGLWTLAPYSASHISRTA